MLTIAYSFYTNVQNHIGMVHLTARLIIMIMKSVSSPVGPYSPMHTKEPLNVNYCNKGDLFPTRVPLI